MIKLLLLALFFLTDARCQTQQECLSRDYGNGGTVCVCNNDYCDTIPKPQKVESPQYLIHTSNKAGLRFKKDVAEFVSSSNSENQIVVNSDIKYQEILGWGGAFTDTTGLNIKLLEEDLQDKLLRSYFDENGIEYSTCRVPIGGTDFSPRGYSYDDGEIDPELNNFALADEDFLYKIPYIKKATELTQGKLRLFASAWTAPKWMKTNGEYAGLGFLKLEMFQPWANYFVKFLDYYKNEGIVFWGITTGNEPTTAFAPGNAINTVGWLSFDMGTWIINNLGPAIRNSNHSDIKIMTLDDARMWLPFFADTALYNETARNYIDGIAVHWYEDYFTPAFLLSDTHDHFPEKFLLATEACHERPVTLGSWDRGEKYTIDIMDDLHNWVAGWIDWNMVVDLDGGPSYIENAVDANIIINATAGEFYKQPTFYHLGHFSKFVPIESFRIDANMTFDSNVTVAAFQKRDDGIVVIILNPDEQVVPISVLDETRGTAQLEISEKSITTILYW